MEIISVFQLFVRSGIHAGRQQKNGGRPQCRLDLKDALFHELCQQNVRSHASGLPGSTARAAQPSWWPAVCGCTSR